MEYIYSALLLYKAKKKIDEASITKILEAAGLKPEPARIKALVAALEGVDIEKAIEKAAVAPVSAVPAAEEKKEGKKEKTAEEEKKEEAKAAAGLGALFG